MADKTSTLTAFNGISKGDLVKRLDGRAIGACYIGDKPVLAARVVRVYKLLNGKVRIAVKVMTCEYKLPVEDVTKVPEVW